MESICSDLLEQVQLIDTQLMVIAIAVQLSSDRKVKAIQIWKDDCNIVFNVSHGLNPFFIQGNDNITTIPRRWDSHQEHNFLQHYVLF